MQNTKLESIIENAIELYEGEYSDVIKALIRGDLSSSLITKENILKLEKLLDENLNQTSGDEKKPFALVKLSNAIQNMSSPAYKSAIENAYSAIEKNQGKIKEIEQIFGSSGATFQDATTQCAVELLKLIDSEMKKATKLSKISDFRAVAIEEIKAKAKRTKSIYENADIVKLMPYLSDSLTAYQCNQYICDFENILEMYRTAYGAVAEVENNRRRCIASLKASKDMLPSELKALPDKAFKEETVQKINDDFIKAVFEIMSDRTTSTAESTKKIAELKARTVASINSPMEDLMSISNEIVEFFEKSRDYLNRYSEYKNLIPKVIEEKTAGRLQFAGNSLLGKLNTKVIDAKTGENKIVGGVDGEISTTDNEFLVVLFDRLILHPRYLKAGIERDLDKSENLDKAKGVVKKYRAKLDKCSDELDGDFNALVEFYDALLNYRQKFYDYDEDNKSALAYFFDNFNPRDKRTGKPKYATEVLEAFVKHSRKSLENEAELRGEEFKTYADLFAYSIIKHFNEITPEERLEKPISKFLDVKKASKDATAKLFANGKIANVTTELESEYSAINMLKDKKTASMDVATLFSNAKLANKLKVLSLYFTFENACAVSITSIGATIAHINGDRDRFIEHQKELGDLETDSFALESAFKNGAYADETFINYIEMRLATMNNALTLTKYRINASDLPVGEKIEELNSVLADARAVYDKWQSEIKTFRENQMLNESTTEE